MKIHFSKYIRIIAAAVLLLSSCEEKLDISPRASLAPEDVTAKDAEALLTGCYDGVQGGGFRHFFLSYLTDDNSSDNLKWRRLWVQHQEIDNNDIQTNNSMIDRWWSGYYINISRANNLINVIIDVDANTFTPASRKEEILAEAHFLRAWSYFYLVTRWGDVPLILEGENEEFPERAPENQVWDQIIKDLEYAVDNAPGFSSSYLVSKQSSMALLARVYLYRNNKPEALSLANSLIADNNFALDDYESIFDGTGSSKEFLLQWRNTSNDPAPFGAWLINRLELVLDESLINAFEENDARKNVTVKTSKGISVCGKYPNSGSGTDNWPVARIAEMYLVAAEAQGYPEGVSYINTLREQRGLGDINPASEAEFNDFLLHERRVELAVEGFRWYDLIRYGKAIDVLPNVTSEDQLKYPVPQGERDLNPNLSQNSGY